MPPPEHGEHLALLPDPDDTQSEECQDKDLPSRSLWRGRLSFVLTLLLVVAAVDILSVIYISHIFQTYYADENAGLNELEFANPNVGLDALYKSGIVNASRIEPILNTPRLVAQVYHDHPSRLAPTGEHEYYSAWFGTLSPHERHLQVDPNTHTIVQFRAIDFGMEECALVLRLPGVDEKLEGKDPFLVDSRSMLDFYSLDVPRVLDVKKLSWRTRPSRGNKVSTLLVRTEAETEVARFPCPWGSLHTFEVACAKGSQCLVDVWSTQNTTWGRSSFFMDPRAVADETPAQGCRCISIRLSEGKIIWYISYLPIDVVARLVLPCTKPCPAFRDAAADCFSLLSGCRIPIRTTERGHA
ncbi:hypothetical protein BKA93DRAFT_153763 [Sparassis latifolia]